MSGGQLMVSLRFDIDANIDEEAHVCVFREQEAVSLVPGAL